MASKQMEITMPATLEEWNRSSEGLMPGHLGITFLCVEPEEVTAFFTASKEKHAWNGFLHGGSVVTLADSCCGYGSFRTLPDGAAGFTTIELKTNFLATVRGGDVMCTARPLHLGRTTQVWDATVSARDSGKTLAHFRCTQLVLYK